MTVTPLAAHPPGVGHRRLPAAARRPGAGLGRRDLEAHRGLHRRACSSSCHSPRRTTSSRPSPTPARRSGSGPPRRSSSGWRCSSGRTRSSSTTRATVADLIQVESGKNRRMAIEETCDPPMVMSHYLKRAAKLLAPTKRGGPVPMLTSSTEIRQPKGVVGIIAPWNFPFATGISDAIPALMAGNARGAEARQQDGALAALRRPDAGGGRPAGRPVPGRLRRGPGRRPDADRPRRLRDVHRLHRHRQGDRRAGRPQPHRLLPGARRQEPDDRAGRRRPRRKPCRARSSARSATPARSACTSSGSTCRSPATTSSRTAFVAARRGRWTSAPPTTSGRRWARWSPPDHMRRVKSHVDDAVAKGATVLCGGKPRPDLGPGVLRADDPRRRHEGHALRRHRNLRTRGGAAQVPHGRRSRRAGQRHRLRPQRLGLGQRHRRRAGGGRAHRVRQRQHQRHPGHRLRRQGHAVRRRQELRRRRPPRRPGPAQVHRRAEHGRAEEAGHGPAARAGLREVRRRACCPG